LTQPQTPPASNNTTKVSSMFILIMLVIIAAALILLTTTILVINQSTAEAELAPYILLGGAILLVLAMYYLLQARRRILKLKIEIAPVMATVECRKCGSKTTREFQKGDYVFKELEKCEKCDDKKIITAIYREVKDKEQRSPY